MGSAAACAMAAPQDNCPSPQQGAHKQLMGGPTAEKPADATVAELLKDTQDWKKKVQAAENVAQLGDYAVTVAFDNGKAYTVNIFKPLPYTKMPSQVNSV